MGGSTLLLLWARRRSFSVSPSDPQPDPFRAEWRSEEDAEPFLGQWAAESETESLDAGAVPDPNASQWSGE